VADRIRRLEPVPLGEKGSVSAAVVSGVRAGDAEGVGAGRLGGVGWDTAMSMGGGGVEACGVRLLGRVMAGIGARFCTGALRAAMWITLSGLNDRHAAVCGLRARRAQSRWSSTMKIGMILLVVGMCTAGALTTGCASIGALTGSEGATTGFEKVTWDADVGEINPPSPERRTVYVQFNDATGRGLQMREDLREELTSLGYAVVANPDNAAYKLQVRLISFDRREAGDRADGTSRALAGSSNSASQHVSRNVGGGGLLGTVLDGVGDLVGEGVRNRTTAREWCLVANFTLAEFVPEGVVTTNHSSTVNRTSSGNFAANASGSTGGGRDTVDGQTQTITQLNNHREIRRTLTASTSKWGLSEAEAYDRLLPRLRKAAANALPAAL